MPQLYTETGGEDALLLFHLLIADLNILFKQFSKEVGSCGGEKHIQKVLTQFSCDPSPIFVILHPSEGHLFPIISDERDHFITCRKMRNWRFQVYEIYATVRVRLYQIIRFH